MAGAAGESLRPGLALLSLRTSAGSAKERGGGAGGPFQAGRLCFSKLALPLAFSSHSEKHNGPRSL